MPKNRVSGFMEKYKISNMKSEINQGYAANYFSRKNLVENANACRKRHWKMYFYIILERKQVMKMLRYEIKKVFSKSKNRIAVIVLFVILAITSILTINRVEYVDENGNSSVGISAVRDLREAKNQWAGYLTADTLSKALEENRTINSSKEALSDDITEQNKAYAKKQGIAGIMDVIICAFSDYRDYNYYVTDQISDDEVGTIYERRISTLKNWLESGEERFTQAEKDFMIQK